MRLWPDGGSARAAVACAPRIALALTRNSEAWEPVTAQPTHVEQKTGQCRNRCRSTAQPQSGAPRLPPTPRAQRARTPTPRLLIPYMRCWLEEVWLAEPPIPRPGPRDIIGTPPAARPHAKAQEFSAVALASVWELPRCAGEETRAGFTHRFRLSMHSATTSQPRVVRLTKKTGPGCPCDNTAARPPLSALPLHMQGCTDFPRAIWGQWPIFWV